MKLELNNKGFNLLIMSVTILALSMVMTASLSFYSLKNVKEKVIETKNKFEAIDLALKKFVIINNRFPCPAPLDCDLSGCENTSYSMGLENGTGSKNSDESCTVDSKGIFGNVDDVYYGNIPAASLGLSKDYLVDAWKNKIVYMVPKELIFDNSFKVMIFNKQNNITKEYLGDGRVYQLLSFNKTNKDAFAYDSKNSFSNNLIVVNTTINTDYFNFYKKYTDFDIFDLKSELQTCSALSDSSTSFTFNFPESDFGEIAFSEEECSIGNKITPQNQTLGYIDGGDSYYMSTYFDSNGSLIDNRPAKRCGQNRIWGNGFVYSCQLAAKCKISDLAIIYDKALLPNFDIVNTGTVTFLEDKDNLSSPLITMVCLVERDFSGNWITDWYHKN